MPPELTPSIVHASNLPVRVVATGAAGAGAAGAGAGAAGAGAAVALVLFSELARLDAAKVCVTAVVEFVVIVQLASVESAGLHSPNLAHRAPALLARFPLLLAAINTLTSRQAVKLN